jgi:hypothetical protein
MVIVEEAEMPSRSDGLYAKLKDIITSERLGVNMKGVPAYEIDNHLNLCIQSNNVDVLKLDSFDRRFAVFDIVNPALERRGEDFWALRFSALRAGLCEAVYQWFLDYDTGDFDPYDVAIETEAKRTMYDATRTPREEFVDMLMHDPDSMLPDKAALYTSAQLEFLFKGTGEEVNANMAKSMGKVLAAARLPQLKNRNGDPAVLRGPFR